MKNLVIEDLKVPAKWTDDCQGKKDYDGDLISVSTRYWPGPDGGGFMVTNRTGDAVSVSSAPYGPRPSAKAEIVVNSGYEEVTGSPRIVPEDQFTIREQEFEGDTLEDVQAQVEAWVKDQYLSIVRQLIQ